MKLKLPFNANAINTSVFLPALALDLKLTLKFPKKRPYKTLHFVRLTTDVYPTGNREREH